MRSIFVALLLAAFGTANAADEDRTYAIVSLLGDGLSIVIHEVSTGSRVDRNPRSFVKLETPALDRAALFAADDAIKRAVPGARTVLLEVRDPAAYAAQSRALDEGGDARRVLAAIGPTLEQSKATHVVLFTKWRHEAMLTLPDGHAGSGQLEGLGFYIDRKMQIVNREASEPFLGFLSAFAYFRVSLIEAATGKALAEESIYVSETSLSVGGKHPWDTMTSQEKVSALQSMVRRETERVMPALLRKR
ncbi:MAG TPA: hypothetical protein VF348_09900 [Usitatibacter sp.]